MYHAAGMHFTGKLLHVKGNGSGEGGDGDGNGGYGDGNGDGGYGDGDGGDDSGGDGGYGDTQMKETKKKTKKGKDKIDFKRVRWLLEGAAAGGHKKAKVI